MPKSYLAIKAVNEHGSSIFVQNPLLVRNYKVGSRVKAVHPKLPMFLASLDEVGHRGVSVGYTYSKLLLVRVPASKVDLKVPHGITTYLWDEDASKTKDINLIADTSHLCPNYFGTMSLTVLEKIPNRINLHEFLKKAARKYKHKILSRNTFKS